jgi:hypothetical protein
MLSDGPEMPIAGIPDRLCHIQKRLNRI